jgi:hypothetical protein
MRSNGSALKLPARKCTSQDVWSMTCFEDSPATHVYRPAQAPVSFKRLLCGIGCARGAAPLPRAGVRGRRLETLWPPPGARTARPRTRRLEARQELGLRAAPRAVSRTGEEELATAVRRVKPDGQRGPKAAQLMGNHFDARLPAPTDNPLLGGVRITDQRLSCRPWPAAPCINERTCVLTRRPTSLPYERTGRPASSAC